MIATKYLDFYKTWLSAVIGWGELVISTIVVTLLSIAIIRKLHHSALAERSRSNEGQQLSSQKREFLMAKVVVLISSTFVLLRLPNIITFYINEYKEELWPDMSRIQAFHIYKANSLSFCFSTLNYVTIYLLFCVAGKILRMEVRKCLMSCCQHSQ